MTPTATLFDLTLDEIRPGDSYESEPRTVSSADVEIFAALTGDHHPVHTDEEWAAHSPFGGRIAHGMLGLSCAVGALPLDPERVIALRRIRDVVFKRPIAVGEQIRVGCKVLGTREIDDASGLVECEWRICGTDGKLRTLARVEVLWRRGDPDRGLTPIPDATQRSGAAKGSDPKGDGHAPAAKGSDPSSNGHAQADEGLGPVEVNGDGVKVLI